MKKKLIRVAISGISGRMGSQLIRSIKNSKEVILVAALASVHSDLCGIDIGEYIGIGSMGVLINNSLIDVIDVFDVLIDFTTPAATLDYLKICNSFKKSIVIGTTGFTEDQLAFICSCSESIGIVVSANFSIGINVMLNLLKRITLVMGKTSDIKIIETHHRNKVDSPSGTALAIGKSVTDVLKSNVNDIEFSNHEKVHNVKGIKKLGTVEILSLRAGNIIGEHSVCFFGMHESIEISHKAYSRNIFSEGAICAAIWLVMNSKIGLFNMSDVLGLNEF